MLLKATVCLCVVLLGCEATIYKRKVEKQILDNILSSATYDPRIRPSGPNGTIDKPLDVVVNLYIRTIHKIDDEKMMYSMDITFRQEWVDERLKYSQIPGINYVTMDDDEFIWTPDLFFNDYKGHHHDVTRPNTLLRLHPNGSILLSKRYTLILYCTMDLAKFPFDQQTCTLRMESYAWSGADIALKWKDPPEGSVFVSTSLDLQFFTLEKFWTTSGYVKVTTGEYPFLMLSLLFQRELNYYLIQVFIPCTMMVLCGYLTFWIDTKRHFVARIILALSTLYTASMMVSNVNWMEIPKTSYTKAIDVYTGITLTFLFFALVETIVVYYLISKEGDGESKSSENLENPGSKVKQIKKWITGNSDNKVDSVSRVFYPGLFIIFLIVYWITCLSM